MNVPGVNMTRDEFLRAKLSLIHYLKQARLRWWIPAGMVGYYLACSSIDAGFLYYSAFLLGVAFGGFCCAPERSYQSSELGFKVALYYILSFPGHVVVWSSLRVIASERVGLLLVVGLLFVCISVIFGRMAYVDRIAGTGLRVSILLGPVLSGSLIGGAALLLAFSHYGFVPKDLMQIPITLMVGSLLSWFVSALCFILIPRPTATTLPPRRKTG
jgi:hypothetical protein